MVLAGAFLRERALLFIFRIRFGVMSVLARLGARANCYHLGRQLVDDLLARAGT